MIDFFIFNLFLFVFKDFTNGINEVIYLWRLVHDNSHDQAVQVVEEED